MQVIQRGSTFHLRRRVPTRYRRVEPRETVWISLHTDSLTVAESKADRAWAQMIEAWEARLAGDTDDAEARFAAAQELARVRGFRYLDIGKVMALPATELVERIEAIPAPNGQPNSVEAAALLGTVPEPSITVSKALDLYWGLARDKVLVKSADQIRRWRNPRKKAVRNFIEFVGDKGIDEITRDDMLEFRQHWMERIEAGEVTPNSANKDLTHLGTVLKTVNRMKRLGLALPLGELSFAEGEARTRPPFSDDWIRTKLLARGARRAEPRGTRHPDRNGEHWLSPLGRGGADPGHDPAGQQRAAHLDPARRAAVEDPVCPPADPAGGRLLGGVSGVPGRVPPLPKQQCHAERDREQIPPREWSDGDARAYLLLAPALVRGPDAGRRNRRPDQARPVRTPSGSRTLRQGCNLGA